VKRIVGFDEFKNGKRESKNGEPGSVEVSTWLTNKFWFKILMTVEAINHKQNPQNLFPTPFF
jgi:hypothetical protein